MKKILLFVLFSVCCISLTYAQLGVGQQLPNNNFESWRNETGSYTAPENWHSVNTATGTLASVAKSDFISSQSAHPGGTGSLCARVTSKTVYFKTANGSLSTGRFHVGNATPSNTANCSYTTTTSGYNHQFTAYPDSIYIWVYTSHKSSSTNSRFNIVIHNNVKSSGASNNAIYQDPTPSSASASVVNTTGTVNDGKVVAKVTWNGRSAGKWTQLKLPFSYTSNNTTPS